MSSDLGLFHDRGGLEDGCFEDVLMVGLYVMDEGMSKIGRKQKVVGAQSSSSLVE